jgi:hypothetical protein
LSDFLPKKPTQAELAIMKEMFDASVDGMPFDNERWGQYFRPYGLEAPASSSTSTSASVDAATIAVDDDLPFEPGEPVKATAPVVSSDKAQDILAKIRARQGNQV